MDGGRRLLRSLTDFSQGQALPAAVNARAWQMPGASNASSRPPLAARPSLRRDGRLSFQNRALAMLTRPGFGLLLGIIVLTGAGVAGALRGGHYAEFVRINGTLPDVIARALGFGLSAIVITSDKGMSNDEILQASGINTNASLLFLNANDVRERLKSLPLVKEASVRKLYPDRVAIDIEERQPFALWQKDGAIAVISADGTAIDQMRDDRFNALPMVVGAGANLHVVEFASLLDAAGDLRGNIRAGILVAGRRWNLKMTNGVEIRLPEARPASVLASFMQVEREAHVLDKDIVTLDLRMPGRMIARLTQEAASRRADALGGKRPSGKAGQT